MLSFPQRITKELFQTGDEIVISKTAVTLQFVEKKRYCQQVALAEPCDEWDGWMHLVLTKCTWVPLQVAWLLGVGRPGDRIPYSSEDVNACVVMILLFLTESTV